MTKFNLDTDFNRFAGKEVGVIETVEDTKYTSDHRADRVNVHVNKDADGKYRIGRFDIG